MFEELAAAVLVLVVLAAVVVLAVFEAVGLSSHACCMCQTGRAVEEARDVAR